MFGGSNTFSIGFWISRDGCTQWTLMIHPVIVIGITLIFPLYNCGTCINWRYTWINRNLMITCRVNVIPSPGFAHKWLMIWGRFLRDTHNGDIQLNTERERWKMFFCGTYKLRGPTSHLFRGITEGKLSAVLYVRLHWQDRCFFTVLFICSFVSLLENARGCPSNKGYPYVLHLLKQGNQRCWCPHLSVVALRLLFQIITNSGWWSYWSMINIWSQMSQFFTLPDKLTASGKPWKSRWWFKIFFVVFTPNFGEDSHFD